ncbi:MAG: OpgC domain-containing protein [Planctomycetota bacterium]
MAMPLLWLMRRKRAGRAGACRCSSTRSPSGAGWAAECADGSFDPLAYQFLFALGMLTALGGMQPLARHRRAVVARGERGDRDGRVPLGFSTLVNAGIASASWDCLPASLYRPRQLGPLRIVHFIAFAYLLSSWTRPQSTFWRSRLAWPLVVCGHHPLEVFCFGMVLTYLTMFLLQRTERSHGAVLVVLVLASYAASIVFASYLHWCRRFLREDRGTVEV